jgi:hypothetical protein
MSPLTLSGGTVQPSYLTRDLFWNRGGLVSSSGGTVEARCCWSSIVEAWCGMLTAPWKLGAGMKNGRPAPEWSMPAV